VTELPAKAPVYGTLVGLLNVNGHDIVGKLMTEFNKTLEEALSESNFFKVKLLLRFYGELVNANVILPATYCGLLNDLLAPLDQSNQLRQRLDCIVYIILATLPWCGKDLSERNSSELNQILKKIEIYMQRRGNIPSLDIFYRFKNNTESQDVLAHVWTLILDLQNNNWDLPVIPKLYKWFDKDFSSALQHDLPRFTVANHNDNVTYIAPAASFKLLTEESGKAIPAHDSIEYFILQETMYDTLHLYEVNRKDCARYLLAIGTSFNPKSFKSIPSGPSDDGHHEPMDTDDEPGKWNLTDLICEVSTLFHLFNHTVYSQSL
jgi:nuclear cap-binding protein subunit 1